MRNSFVKMKGVFIECWRIKGFPLLMVFLLCASIHPRVFALDISGYDHNKVILSSADSLKRIGFFESTDILNFTLKVDFSSLFEDVGDKRKYHSGHIDYRDKENNYHQVGVKVKTRGKFRLRKKNCDFPPLRFRFSHEETSGTVFAGQKKLKLVTHCQSIQESYEQHTLEEYLIYRIYNLISDYSFRVRLARISYVGVHGGDTLQRYGFFLEDQKQMASRCRKSIMNYKNIKQHDVLRHNMVMLSLFQLMIGNCDWSVERLHNIELISQDENSIPVAVPFDFDWAALIGHSYYTADPRIDSTCKYKRLYKGLRWSKQEFESAFEEYNELKESILELIIDLPYMKKENKDKCINYVSEFYQIINSRRDIKNILMKNAPSVP